MLLVLVMLTRGLGQSALSVASLNLVGQWFQRRLTKAMGLYSVLASALGPLLLAGCVELTGSYAPVFRIMAAVVALLAVAAWLVKVPEKASGEDDSNPDLYQDP